MEELPYADASFDVVTGFSSFQFAENPVNALREARRVVKPGGYVAMVAWGRMQDCKSIKGQGCARGTRLGSIFAQSDISAMMGTISMGQWVRSSSRRRFGSAR
jgi:ubiquinone/menaquinone biosynthesis C-methylase UbiE